MVDPKHIHTHKNKEAIMPSWGNEPDDRNDQDMISGAIDEKILKVSDANDQGGGAKNPRQ